MTPDEIEELLREGAEAFNDRDVEACVPMWDAECEWHPFLTAEVEGGTGYQGHDGIRQWFRDTDEMFSEIEWQVDEIRHLGDDRVVVLGVIWARGRASGADVSAQVGQLLELREGRVLRGWAYSTHEQTLNAAGLSPQDAS